MGLKRVLCGQLFDKTMTKKRTIIFMFLKICFHGNNSKRPPKRNLWRTIKIDFYVNLKRMAVLSYSNEKITKCLTVFARGPFKKSCNNFNAEFITMLLL